MRSRSDTNFLLNAPFLVRVFRNNASVLIFLLVAVSGMFLVHGYFSNGLEQFVGVSAAEMAEISDPEALVAFIRKPRPDLPVLQRMPQSPPPLRIGIIAGHRGFDSGTLCTDGLTEALITNDVAERLVAVIKESGVGAELLDEFDPRLDNYAASALVSIHVDSCDYINELATGFKISGSSYTDSSALTLCLQQEYGGATNLPYHPNSITPHMSNYHAFRKIAQGTPAAIIEIGFLNLDREILTEDAELVVEGLANGITCFLNTMP